MESKRKKRIRRHRRVRAKIMGTDERPRLSVFRSSSHIYAQLIDDVAQRTLAAANDLALKPKKAAAKGKDSESMQGRKIVMAHEVGRALAEIARKKGIERVVFDRGGFAYHGRIKALAEGAHAGGLKF